MGNYVNISVSGGIGGAVFWQGQAAWQISFQERGFFPWLLETPGGSRKELAEGGEGYNTHEIAAKCLHQSYFVFQIFFYTAIKMCAGSPFFAINWKHEYKNTGAQKE